MRLFLFIILTGVLIILLTIDHFFILPASLEDYAKLMSSNTLDATVSASSDKCLEVSQTQLREYSDLTMRSQDILFLVNNILLSEEEYRFRYTLSNQAIFDNVGNISEIVASPFIVCIESTRLFLGQHLATVFVPSKDGTLLKYSWSLSMP